jgi:hypothetical protein
MLLDYRHVMVERKGASTFTDKDVLTAMHAVSTVALHEVVRVGDGLEMTPYYAGHVLGAVMLHVQVGMQGWRRRWGWGGVLAGVMLHTGCVSEGKRFTRERVWGGGRVCVEGKGKRRWWHASSVARRISFPIWASADPRRTDLGAIGGQVWFTGSACFSCPL